MAVKTKQAEGGVPEQTGVCCYIGPSVRGVIQTCTIYPCAAAEAAALPEVALALSAKPEIADLIFDCKELQTARERIKNPGDPLFALAKKIAQNQ